MSEKSFKVFDEKENLLYKTSGFGGSKFFENKIFRCSKCFKRYFVPWFLKKHFNNCKGIWQDSGIKEVNKQSQKLQLLFMDSFGSMSRQIQEIDTSMTGSDSIKNLNQTSLVYVENSKPLGFITFSKRKFQDGEKYSLDDFFVLHYMERKGIGTKLFEEMLNKLNLDKEDSQKIEKNLVVCSPSQMLVSFLEKKGHNLLMW